MPDLSWHEFDSRPQLDSQLAGDVAGWLAAAIAVRGRATLVVSGGTTPLSFFQQLAHAQLAWECVTVTLADERWVGSDHPDSNARLVRTHLLSGAAARAQFLDLYTGAASPAAGAQTLAPALAALGRFDVVILGMGDDGHTASLFPRAAALAAGLELESGLTCIAVEPPAAPHRRLSLTLPRLLNTAHLLLHITGAGKRAVLEQAARTPAPLQWPISAVLCGASVPVMVYWAP